MTRFTLALLTLVLLPLPAAHATGPWSGKPFRALHLESSTREPGVVERQRIFLSRAGYRAENLGTDGLISIVNYGRRLCWFIRKDGTYIEDDMDPVTGYCSPVTLPPAMEPKVALGGVHADRPCDGFDLSKRLGSGQVDGRSTQHWACGHSATRQEAQHWFDAGYGMVVREQTDDGTTLELRNVRFAPQAANLFQLPAGLRQAPKLKFPFQP